MKAPTRDQIRLIANGPNGKRKIDELRAMAERYHKGAVEQLSKHEAARRRVEIVRDETAKILADIAAVTGEVKV